MEMERSEAAPPHRGLTEDELLVADIMLELRWLFTDRFPRGWGSKRRRSALRSGSSSPSPSPAGPSPPPPAKCSVRAAIEDRVGPPKVHAPSPDTPLTFSPSESDGNKPKQSHSHAKRKSTKRKREDWLKLIELLKEQGDALRKEVENVRRYRDQVKALNSELKTRKEKLIARVIPGDSEQGPELNTRLSLWGQPAELSTAVPLPSGADGHLPRIPDQTASTPEKNEARGGGRGRDIPDLNIGLAPFDATMVDEEWSIRARAAQARQRRKLIYKAKNSTAAVKPRVMLR